MPKRAVGTARSGSSLADDHAVLREGVALLIEREADMCVVGQASGGREALELAQGAPAGRRGDGPVDAGS